MRLRLFDRQCAGLPADRIHRKPCNLAWPKSIMRHQVQHDEVSPAAPVCSVNCSQELLDERPVKCPRRQFLTKAGRTIDEVEPHGDQSLVKAVAQEGPQVADDQTQIAPRVPTCTTLDVLFNGLGAKVLKRLAR